MLQLAGGNLRMFGTASACEATNSQGGTPATKHSAMPYGLYISAEGAAAQSKRMEVLANNMANVDTPGFKRQLAVLQARHAEAIRQGLASPSSGTINDVGGGVEVPLTMTTFGQGVIERTQRPTDMAIEGEGFFMVQGEGTSKFLTRAGDFKINMEGMLVTQDGKPVLAEDGTPIQLDPTLPWAVSPQGVVRQDSYEAPLALVRPKHMADLVHEGTNLFRSLSTVENLEANERNIHTGYLELSGVRPTTEMMEMIEASRAFESNVRLIQNQDQAMGQLISRVMRQS